MNENEFDYYYGNESEQFIFYKHINRKMDTLKKEYAILDAEKRKLYQGYRPAREEMIALLMAKQNVDRILNITPTPQKSHEKSGQEL